MSPNNPASGTRDYSDDERALMARLAKDMIPADPNRPELHWRDIGAAPSSPVAVPPAEAAPLDLDAMQRARSRVRANLVAVSPQLQTPYTDAPDQTPWSRFVSPAVNRMDEAFGQLIAEVERLREIAVHRTLPDPSNTEERR